MVRKALIFVLILIPFSQLALLSVANRVHPIIIGLPFFHFWLLFWIAVTPFCSFLIYRLQKKQGGLD
ncbi:DUF3311 domain-containing protein [Bacillus velezensis]|uniref:DUF3311 domain-containing protein n=1 Tax=Bacillus velezensis TaxID=492670 RepID=UPI0011A3E6F6|nr:DUF3311 domain-containing protein [Bacillus velezensis]